MMPPAANADSGYGTAPLAGTSFSGLDDSVGFFARIAYRRFVRAVEKRISSFNITVGQYVVLRQLWTDDGIAQRQLSLKLGVCEPTIAIALRKLEDIGFVSREKNRKNRREMLVYLTRAGQDIRPVLESASFDVNQMATMGLSREEAVELLSLLRRVATNLAANN